MTTRRFYVNNAPTLALAAAITPGVTSCTVSGIFTGYPTQFPFFAELDYGTASAEIVSVTNIIGATATIVRGQGGTSAISHASGATFDFVVVAQDLDEANLHTVATAAVHGVAGTLVGTTDAQTLANKTLAAPALTGTATGAALALTGAFSAASAAISGASTAASYAASGNGAVAGVVVPKTYTNEAAATAAIGSPVTGAVVWLTAPTTSGTVAGLFVYSGTAWTPLASVTARVGARATTNATQSVTATVPATLNNGGTAAWTATEDSGGFVSGTGGSTTPITIPAGKGGLYIVGVEYTQSIFSSGRLYAGIRVNGATSTIRFIGYAENTANGSVPMSLNAGDTLGAEVFSAIASSASIGSSIFAYRLSN